MLKKILKITGITILALLAILFIAPFAFRGKIIALAKSEINKNINAKADFADASVSLFRHFPKVSLLLEDLHITGINGFERDTLISAEEIDVAINLISAIKGKDMKVYSVSIDQPRIHAIVNSQGQANWDIVKEDTAAATPQEQKPFHLELNNYEINNAYISYHDSLAGMQSEIINLNHNGSGDFTSDIFNLNTNTTADAVDFSYGTIPYLNDTKVSIDANIRVDNKTNTYTFKTDEIQLNDLKLSTNGFFQLVNDSTYNMDINFNAPSTDFKHILSLVPAIYQKDFSKVNTSGKALFNGFVKGTMAGEKLPAYNVNLEIQNGFFKYPDLPAPMKNINVSVKVNNPDGVPDHTVVDIPRGHIEIENDPFDFRVLVKNPVTNLFVDAAMKGRLDLSKVSKIVKLEKGTKLAGLLNADVSVKGNVEDAEKQRFDQFYAAGTVRLSDFLYAATDYPDGVTLNNLLMTFNPKNVTLSDASGRYMNTNFVANGTINNLLGYALKDRALNGVINAKVDKVNLNDWMGTDTATAPAEPTSAFVVPANLDIAVNAQAEQVLYDKLDMRNISGALLLSDEAVKLDNLSANALDGKIKISGTYSTKTSKTKPVVTLQYDVEDVDVQKTFLAFNTVQKLMPIGKWLGGTLNSELSLSGRLGEEMMPDFTSLTGNGNLFLIEGFLQKFGPLEKLGERLNINELKDVTLREVRQYFEFTDGKVLVKPFKVSAKGIDMEIGGMHGFDQSLDYTITLKVPRAMMGNAGNQFVNDLAAKAAGRGIPVKLSDFVNLHVKMGGTISNPSFNINLKETASSLADDIKQQAKDFAQAKIDSAKQAVKDTLQSLKKEAVREASERLKKEIFGRKDTTVSKDTVKATDPKTKAKESAKDLLKGILRKPKTDTTKKN